ncbi:MAG: lytic transglycosylase domain-containing protein, partial [Chloroflexi bacterium]|nr:lytic transglycosylase domain-containing protein [Chloroflexota bacterium]
MPPGRARPMRWQRAPDAPGGSVPTDPIRPPSPAWGSPEPAPASATGPPGAPDFAALLREQFEEPWQRIQDVRAAHAAAAVEGAATSKLLALRQVASNGPDPHGWRSMTREAGDRLVGAGFGSLFERQIDQESGFAPDVVFGRRRSSAGAEGVAQLMPEYYPSVDRPDPQESLIAAAQTMRHYLEVWDGDARKALASYNAGLGRVRSLVEARGADWERRLPEETKHYLANLVRPGELTYVLPPRAGGEVAVFGGRGPGGVLTSPLDRVGG